MLLKNAKKLATFIAAAAVVVSGLVSLQPANAEAVRIDDGPLARSLNLPVYQWQDMKQNPRAVVLAIHGLTMHGTVFDVYAQRLAADGAIVVAPDLRGYGAWYENKRETQIDYAKSENDLDALASSLKQRYPDMPLFVSGESLGGTMAIRLAAKHPELIDGLILCAPAIKIHHSGPARSIVDATRALAARDHQFDLSECIKENFSEDSNITREEMSDPLIRTRMGMSDLLESCRLIESTKHFIKQIRPGMPVLVLQGERDRMVKPSGVTLLTGNLKTANATVELFPQRGHILIETRYVKEETMNTIVAWMNSQCVQYARHNSAIAANANISHLGG